MSAKVTELRKARSSWIDPGRADIEFADLLHEDHSTYVIYEASRGWYIYDQRRYRYDSNDAILVRCESTVARVREEVRCEAEPKHREALEKFAKKYSHARAITGALKFLQSRCAVELAKLDADPALFNIASGTINLKTGEHLPHRQKDLITKISDIVFDAKAAAPRWRKFLLEVFGCPNPDEHSDEQEQHKNCGQLAGYIARLVGYALTAEQRDHVLPILIGGGGNGKSTFVKILLALTGEYGQAAPASLLMKKYGDQIPTDVADLRGARVVVASETPEDGRLDEERVKLLTGAEAKIKARHMRHDFFEFAPTHHLFLQTNHRPRVSGTDYAIWRRIRLIPFNVRFEEETKENPAPEHLKDLKLAETLLEELPGILNWAIEGAKDWYEHGLQDPEFVLEATKKYRGEENVLSDFLEDSCERRPEYSESVKMLYDAYRVWCKSGGENPWAKNRFSRRLTDEGFGSAPTPARVRTGLRLNEAAREELRKLDSLRESLFSKKEQSNG
jgi:putative DNA primase/helicase